MLPPYKIWLIVDTRNPTVSNFKFQVIENHWNYDIEPGPLMSHSRCLTSCTGHSRDTVHGDSIVTIHHRWPLPDVRSPRHPYYPHRHGTSQQNLLLTHTPLSSVHCTEPPCSRSALRRSALLVAAKPTTGSHWSRAPSTASCRDAIHEESRRPKHSEELHPVLLRPPNRVHEHCRSPWNLFDPQATVDDLGSSSPMSFLLCWLAPPLPATIGEPLTSAYPNRDPLLLG
jgi:hypothetical protein